MRFKYSNFRSISSFDPHSNSSAEYRKANFIVSLFNIELHLLFNLPFVGQVLCVCCTTAVSHLLLLADHLRQDHTGQVTQPGGGLQDQVAAGQAGEGVHKGAGQHY